MTFSPATGRLLLLSIGLVSLTTVGLYELQTELMFREHAVIIRPFTIAYLVPLLLLTTLGGKWIGRLTLLLAVSMTSLCLIMPFPSMHVQSPRLLTEMAMLLVVGEVIVRVIDKIQQDMALLEDVERTPFTASLLENVKASMQSVPGVAALGPCVLRRRGLEYFVDAVVYVSGGQSVREGLSVASHAEEAARSVYRLIGDVKVRLNAAD